MDIILTKYGFNLKNNTVLFAMNKSNHNNQYYLKQLEPDLKYITGLFKQRAGIYRGKTTDNKTVLINLHTNTIEIGLIKYQ